jgi:hypothetical protein
MDASLCIFHPRKRSDFPGRAVTNSTSYPDIRKPALRKLIPEVIFKAAPRGINTAVQHGRQHTDQKNSGKGFPAAKDIPQQLTP